MIAHPVLGLVPAVIVQRSGKLAMLRGGPTAAGGYDGKSHLVPVWAGASGSGLWWHERGFD